MAGVIFAGQVIEVRRHGASNGATGVVEIDFAVEDAVRGVSAGRYTLREWAGLWAGGDQPFRVGQRYLMVLHSPGASGLSSPVGGPDGAIPIRGAGPAIGPSTPGSAAPPTGQSRLVQSTAEELHVDEIPVPLDGRVVDLRWVATRVQRAVVYRAPPPARPVTLHAYGVSASGAESSAGAGEDPSPAATGFTLNPTGAPTVSSESGAPYASVLGLLRAWEADDHAAR